MEQMTVTLWSSYSGKNGEAETALVEKFNAENEDAQVAYEFQGSYEECAQKVTAALQAGIVVMTGIPRWTATERIGRSSWADSRP